MFARFWKQLGADKTLLAGGLLLLALISWLLLWRLGTITAGFSAGEHRTLSQYVGWHGIYENPFYLPLDIIRSIVFFASSDPGLLLSRLPNAFFGGLTIISFGLLVHLWHGTRTALLATVLFGCSAWLLHVSRLATFDVLYLWVIPTLLLTQVLLKKYFENPLVWYGSLAAWMLMLYIPGAVWLVAAGVWLQRHALRDGWQHFYGWRQRGITAGIIILSLPLLLAQLFRDNGLITWLGLPEQMAAGMELVKQFAAVPVHLFIRGPQYPELWLGKLPILDIFSLVVCLLGIYFYVTRWRASRSQSLAVFLIIGGILVGLGGPVPLSLLVPLLYLAAATGIAYLLHEWLKVFPLNPLARGLGIGLVTLAVAFSCAYNTRAYFVAWSNNSDTRAAFHYRR